MLRGLILLRQAIFNSILLLISGFLLFVTNYIVFNWGYNVFPVQKCIISSTPGKIDNKLWGLLKVYHCKNIRVDVKSLAPESKVSQVVTVEDTSLIREVRMDLIVNNNKVPLVLVGNKFILPKNNFKYDIPYDIKLIAYTPKEKFVLYKRQITFKRTKIISKSLSEGKYIIGNSFKVKLDTSVESCYAKLITENRAEQVNSSSKYFPFVSLELFGDRQHNSKNKIIKNVNDIAFWHMKTSLKSIPPKNKVKVQLLGESKNEVSISIDKTLLKAKKNYKLYFDCVNTEGGRLSQKQRIIKFSTYDEFKFLRHKLKGNQTCFYFSQPLNKDEVSKAVFLNNQQIKNFVLKDADKVFCIRLNRYIENQLKISRYLSAVSGELLNKEHVFRFKALAVKSPTFSLNAPIYRNIHYGRVRQDLKIFSGKTRRIATLIAPLPKDNYYYGKFENGRASALIIDKYTRKLYPGSYFYLLKGHPQRLKIESKYGFVDTPKGFGMGACWGVSVLGGLIDRVNYWFRQHYGVYLFAVLEKHPHRQRYSTYRGINGGYGYAIWDSPSYKLDYRFVVNPHVKTFIKNISIRVYPLTNYSGGYQGKAIGGYVNIVYK